MRRTQLSIAGVMGAIVVAAGGLTAFRSGSTFSLRAFYTLTVAILLLATLAARLSREGRRPFWFGFAAFGWAYLVLGLGLRPGVQPHDLGTQPESIVNPFLYSTEFIRWAHYSLNEEFRAVRDVENTGRSLAIGHMLLTLGVAVLGGLAAGLFGGGGAVAPTQLDAPAPVPVARRLSRRTRLLGASAGLVLLVALGLCWYFSEPYGPYFPDLAFDPLAGNHAFVAERYGRQLEAMREPSLWKRAERGRDDLAFRLLWIPEDDHPVAIRVEKAGEIIRLHAVMLDGEGGFEPGVIALTRDIHLGEDQWDDLVRRLDKAGYWTMPTRTSRERSRSAGPLLLEGVSPGRYHVVEADPPGSPLLDVARYLLKLADLTLYDVSDFGGFHG